VREDGDQLKKEAAYDALSVLLTLATVDPLNASTVDAWLEHAITSCHKSDVMTLLQAALASFVLLI
jgi:hypothetical protein